MSGPFPGQWPAGFVEAPAGLPAELCAFPRSSTGRESPHATVEVVDAWKAWTLAAQSAGWDAAEIRVAAAMAAVAAAAAAPRGQGANWATVAICVGRLKARVGAFPLARCPSCRTAIPVRDWARAVSAGGPWRSPCSDRSPLLVGMVTVPARWTSSGASGWVFLRCVTDSSPTSCDGAYHRWAQAWFVDAVEGLGGVSAVSDAEVKAMLAAGEGGWRAAVAASRIGSVGALL